MVAFSDPKKDVHSAGPQRGSIEQISPGQPPRRAIVRTLLIRCCPQSKIVISKPLPNRHTWAISGLSISTRRGADCLKSNKLLLPAWQLMALIAVRFLRAGAVMLGTPSNRLKTSLCRQNTRSRDQVYRPIAVSIKLHTYETNSSRPGRPK